MCVTLFPLLWSLMWSGEQYFSRIFFLSTFYRSVCSLSLEGHWINSLGHEGIQAIVAKTTGNRHLNLSFLRLISTEKKTFLFSQLHPFHGMRKPKTRNGRRKWRKKNVENVTIRIRQRIHFSNGIRKSRSFLSASAIRWKRKTENSSRGLGTRYVKPKVYKVFFIFSFEKIVNRAQLSTVNINSLYVFQHFLLFRFFFCWPKFVKAFVTIRVSLFDISFQMFTHPVVFCVLFLSFLNCFLNCICVFFLSHWTISVTMTHCIHHMRVTIRN